jgi:hypothetical protein
MTRQPIVGQGQLIVKDSRLYSDTPHSVRHLWTSDRPDVEICTRQHTTLTTDIHAPPEVLEPAIPASERSQTHALDRAATGIGF